MTFVVIGYGSIGRRHVNNLRALGIQSVVVEPNIMRQNEARKNSCEVFSSIESVQMRTEFRAVVICSPPKFHIEHLNWALANGKKVFLEKPIAMSLEECKSVRLEHHENIFVGYTYRWNEQFLQLKEIVEQGSIGKPFFARFTIGANLEDWHPWEDYRDFFMSKSFLGGGALLDESHFLELAIELFGIPDQVVGRQSKISNLEIDSDDYVFAQLRYQDLLVDIHLDLFSRPHKSMLEISGSLGSVICDLISKVNQLTISKSYANFETELYKFEYERNDVFSKMTQDFTIFVDSKDSNARVPFSRGLEVMSLIEKIRDKSKNNFWIAND